MKYLAILLLLIACLCSHAAVGDSPDNPATVSAATIFEWDAVTKTTDGDVVTTVTYVLATFELGNTNMLRGSVTAITNAPTPSLPPPGIKYEVRVKAIALDGMLQSLWSEPFYIIRAPPGLAIGKVRIKP